MKDSPEKSGMKVIAENRKARFNYQIVETFEAGMVLTGAEIKSIRQGGISLQESYVAPYKGELFLLSAHIKPYSHTKDDLYDPVRRRKLLMHKKEISRLQGKVEQKGLTLIPLKVYLKNGRAKIELALAKGKAAPDKRDDIKDRQAKREIERAVKTAR